MEHDYSASVHFITDVHTCQQLSHYIINRTVTYIYRNLSIQINVIIANQERIVSGLLYDLNGFF